MPDDKYLEIVASPAEGRGFEPPTAFAAPDFESGDALDGSPNASIRSNVLLDRVALPVAHDLVSQVDRQASRNC